MSDEQRFVELWNDFLEGELDGARMVELQMLLAKDEALLKTAADTYQLHRLLGVLSDEQNAGHNEFVQRTLGKLCIDQHAFVNGVMQGVAPKFSREENLGARARRWVRYVVAASLLCLLAGFAWQQFGRKPSIAKITGLSGSVYWTGNDGQVEDDISVGTEVGGGTLEGAAPDSWAELTFVDGSKVTLSGKAMLTFSQQGQKELHLREGNITANVAPQPPNMPMLIHTRSAILEVLGTRFNVEAELSSTMLNVNEGKVRIRKRNDNDAVDVVANHRVVASADRRLEPILVPAGVSRWQSQIELGPDGTFGKWLPADEGSAARLEAIPFVFSPPGKGNESVTVYVAALPVSQGERQPVVVHESSRFRVQGKRAKACEVFFGFQVNDAEGRFAGKFLGVVPLEPNATGEFEGEIPLTQFGLDPSVELYKDQLPHSPDGLVVASCWCVTIDESAGLEIYEAELIPEDVVP